MSHFREYLRRLPRAALWVIRHPLNRRRRLHSAMRWALWQARMAFLSEPRAVPYVGGTRILAGRGMTAANLQHYAGVSDVATMGFLLHVLRPDDLFVDVGANIGTVTVLASGAVGCRTVAIEANPTSVKWLRRNIELNELEPRVEVHAVAVSDRDGMLRFSPEGGPRGHVIADGANGIEVQARCLAGILGARVPRVIKIDVEGWEVPVLDGAGDILRADALWAVVTELRGHGRRYGHDDSAVRGRLTAHGFIEMRYEPFTRELSTGLENDGAIDGIFVRNPTGVRARVESAPARKTIWGEVV